VGLLATWNLLPKSRRFLGGTGLASLISLATLGYLVWKGGLDHSQFYHGLFTAVALMVGIILVRLLSAPARPASRVLASTALVGVGRISYALYLFHLPIIHCVQPAGLGWRHPGNTLLATALSFTAAVLSYICIERPCLRLKRRLEAPDTTFGADPLQPQRLAGHLASTRSAA
jgi:peptidoglycan/LPS O-acetylase OafA/YrhL